MCDLYNLRVQIAALVVGALKDVRAILNQLLEMLVDGAHR